MLLVQVRVRVRKLALCNYSWSSLLLGVEVSLCLKAMWWWVVRLSAAW
jgi:hypothetical protein